MKRIIKGIKTFLLMLFTEYGIMSKEEIKYARKDIDSTKGFRERFKFMSKNGDKN